MKTRILSTTRARLRFGAAGLGLLGLGLLGCANPGPPAVDEAPRVLLVTGGWVMAMDEAGTVIENGAVAAENGRIVALGEAEELAARFPDARRLSAEGGVILPGLINAHTHVPMTLFRGLADDLPLMRWLQEVIFPAEARFVDEAMVRAGTRLACLEMIRGGTTTLVDMYYFEDAIAEEIDACGLRGVLGQTLIDFPAPDFKTWESAVAGARSFLQRWQDHERITPAVAPHAVYTVSAEHLAEADALAAEFSAPVLIHLAEHASEIETVAERLEDRPVRFLDGLGLLGDRVVAAHMVLPTEEEIGLLAARGVGVSHCPQSNMKLGAGVAPVPAMLAAGVDVGLGTDGPASNNDLDMWEEIDGVAKLHKLAQRDATLISARQALEMATLGGARSLDMADEIGSLEVGKRADWIVVGLDGAHQQPLYDLESVLVYSTKAADVRSVVVEGQVLMEDGRLLTVDRDQVIAEAARWAERIAPDGVL